MPDNQNHILSVSKLNHLARTLLEGELGSVWVEAEISNFVRASSGHWYFTLKDAGAQIKSAMFRGNNRSVRTPPKNGDKVTVRGRISLYEPRGDYQLIAEHMQTGGEGALKQKFEQLKARLMAEGLFAQHHKTPIPKTVHRVGIITSASGAALHDMLTVLKRRSPQTQVTIYPTQVQGEAATAQIADMIKLANQRAEVDVLIVGRGGGSLEDLWCFNEEEVARAIFASVIPVISAVGHETDISISDMVADLRAPTPSAAAELVSQDTEQLAASLQRLRQTLSHRVQAYLRHKHQQLQIACHTLDAQHPEARLQQQSQRIDHLSTRLSNSVLQRYQHVEKRVQLASHKLAGQTPTRRIQQSQKELVGLHAQLQQATLRLVSARKEKLAEHAHLLNTLSPLNTLSRGFSLTYTNEGKLVRQAGDVQPEDVIITQLATGEIRSKVV